MPGAGSCRRPMLWHGPRRCRGCSCRVLGSALPGAGRGDAACVRRGLLTCGTRRQAGADHLYRVPSSAPVVRQVHSALRTVAPDDGVEHGAWEPQQLASVGASFASLATSDAERRMAAIALRRSRAHRFP